MSVFQLLASLCQVVAGDTHQYGSTVDEIINYQVHCQGYFAQCLIKNKIDKCIIDHEPVLEKEKAEALRKLKDSK